MAGKVPYSDVNEIPLPVSSPSHSFEEFASPSNREFMSDLLPISRTWSKMSGTSSEITHTGQQLQEQFTFSIDQCLTTLTNNRKNNEAMFIQVQKSIRDKVDTMLKTVKQSYEHMHFENTKQMQLKFEEIGRVLSRIEKMLEEENENFSTEYGTSNSQKTSSGKFLEKTISEKSRIESEVEALIQKLNKKRESDKQIYIDFKEDILQKAQSGISCMEKTLESHAEERGREVKEKMTEMRNALANLQQMSHFS